MGSFQLLRMNSLLIVLLICLLLSVSSVCGTVHMSFTCYNSEARVTENVMTNNADYSGVTVLLPYSIHSKGAGKSVDEKSSEFSHSILVAMDENCEKIKASLNAELGEYGWKSDVKVLPDGLLMGMSVESKIENGNLKATYDNSLATHTEEVTANGAQYSESTIITPDTISSNGMGNSGDGHEADINVNPGEGGIFHKIRIEGNGKWAEMNSTLTAEPMNTSYAWKKSVNAVTQNSSLGMALVGVSNNGSIKTIEMHGKASNFPAQHLPPGEVVVTTAESESNQVDISEAANEFYEDFFENPTALYYNIEQECSIPTGDGGINQSTDIESKEHFTLGMSFLVEHKGNG